MSQSLFPQMALGKMGGKQDVLRTSYSLFFFINTRAFVICPVTDTRGTGTRGRSPENTELGDTDSGTRVERNIREGCLPVLCSFLVTASQPQPLAGSQHESQAPSEAAFSCHSRVHPSVI